MTARLHRLLLSTTPLISPKTLRILDSNTDEIKAYWVLYIDIVCISLDGNVLDPAWASIVAALHSTKLPKAYWDPDTEEVVCYPELSKYRPLDISEWAFISSFAILSTAEKEEMGVEIGRGEAVILNDPDEFEESVCEQRVRVCITAGGKIAWIEHGGGLVELGHIHECVRRAAERYKVWEELLKQVARS